MRDRDTIVALASGALPAGIAVIRLSGPQAFTIVCHLINRTLPELRRLTLRSIFDPRSGELLDRALIVLFPAPHSFTGEDVVELHVHGGPAVVASVIEASQKALPEGACRLAEAGEFTRRAFENERLDLAAVEGLADLVRAETAAQRRHALAGSMGAAQARLSTWREQLMQALALMEANIDFADEDLPEDLMANAARLVETVRTDVESECRRASAGIKLREGLLAAIVGPPNVGKSSLLNALAQKPAAIVSPIPGTTRDMIEVSLDVGGYPMTLADTAGLRETSDAVEREGVTKARDAGARSDITILVLDAADWPTIPNDLTPLAEHATVLVWNKADLQSRLVDEPPVGTVGRSTVLIASAKTGQGLEALCDTLAREAEVRLQRVTGSFVARRRHLEALYRMRDLLSGWFVELEPEIQSHLIFQANRCMASILGHSDVEEMLDLVFRDFCIGK